MWNVECGTWNGIMESVESLPRFVLLCLTHSASPPLRLSASFSHRTVASHHPPPSISLQQPSPAVCSARLSLSSSSRSSAAAACFTASPRTSALAMSAIEAVSHRHTSTVRAVIQATCNESTKSLTRLVCLSVSLSPLFLAVPGQVPAHPLPLRGLPSPHPRAARIPAPDSSPAPLPLPVASTAAWPAAAEGQAKRGTTAII